MHYQVWVAVGQRDDGTYVVFAESSQDDKYGFFQRRIAKALPEKKDFEVMARTTAEKIHPGPLKAWDDNGRKVA